MNSNIKKAVLKRCKSLGSYIPGQLIPGTNKYTIVRAFGPGTLIKASGRNYRVETSGAFTRTEPERPWRGKSDRRIALKLRRLGRMVPCD